MSQKINYGDTVAYNNQVGTVVAVVLKGNDYKLYECLFPDANNEPSTYRLPGCVLEKKDKNEFGFVKKEK